MVEWHHRINGLEFEQALGDGEGHGSLPCCSPWNGKELDMTELLNNKLIKSGLLNDLKYAGTDWSLKCPFTFCYVAALIPMSLS